MSVDGTWKVTVESPMGPQVSTLTLASAEGALTGTQSGQGETPAISEGKIDGNNISWATNVTNPMALKLEYSGVFDGSNINGKVAIGFFGSFPFAAVKE